VGRYIRRHCLYDVLAPSGNIVMYCWGRLFRNSRFDVAVYVRLRAAITMVMMMVVVVMVMVFVMIVIRTPFG